MTSIEDLLAQVQPVTRSVRLCLRGDLIAARQEAERDLQAAQRQDVMLNEFDTAPAIAERIRELEAEADAATVVFKFKALPRKEWIDLVESCPPSAEEAEQGLAFNANFPAVAIAKCSVDPVMAVAHVEQLVAKISTGQFDEIWSTVLVANLNEDNLPKSEAATTILRGSALRSTTALPEGSPGVSS